MITFVKDVWKEQLIQIWNEVFEDSPEYIRAFLAAHYKPEQVVVWEENGTVLTMVFALEAQISYQGKKYPARYLYAIATRPEFRGHGHFQKMFEWMKQQYAPDTIWFLVPVKEVIPYYEKIGFVRKESIKEKWFSGRKEVQKRREIQEKIETQELTPEQYLAMRSQYLQGKDDVIWDENAIRWAITDVGMAQGKCLKLFLEGQEKLLLGVTESGKEQTVFHIIETTFSVQELEQYKEILCSFLQVQKLHVKPLEYMIYTQKQIKELYVNLALN